MRVIAVVSKKPRLAGILFCVYRGIRDELTRLALPVIWFSEGSTVGNMIWIWTTDVDLCFVTSSLQKKSILLSSPGGVQRCQTGLLMWTTLTFVIPERWMRCYLLQSSQTRGRWRLHQMSKNFPPLTFLQLFLTPFTLFSFFCLSSCLCFLLYLFISIHLLPI